MVDSLISDVYLIHPSTATSTGNKIDFEVGGQVYFIRLYPVGKIAKKYSLKECIFVNWHSKYSAELVYYFMRY